ncbi:GUN4 domain-containing protein [Alkalinema pantanalense CENA528]|uniref:GUN4 domain-containing protein n=1 Tax=Alkalinema pantanalense TaxID=1620705 RepID=UPI003D6EDC5A
MANNWAIAVGINNYDFLPEASLSFAVQDALAMRRFLQDEAGFAAEQVLLCGDGVEPGSRRATRPVLRDILLHQIQRAQNADNLWFFFSGHGMAGSDQRDYLMTIDGNPNDLQETAIPIQFVTEQLRACRAKTVVLILDMCRNEQRDAGRKGLDSVEESLRELVKQREEQQGIITLFSCSRGQSSYELEDLQQGAFTYALLEGLRQQTILKDLESHLARRVPELHRNAGKVTRKQVPLVIPEPGWKYEEPILSHYATRQDVARLKEMAIDAECDGEVEKAIRLWEQVNLLAEGLDDRRRALNQLLRLRSGTGNQQSVQPVVQPPLAEQKQPAQKPVPTAKASMPVAKTTSAIDAIPLKSEKGVSYEKLRELLKAEKWEEADRETLRVMLEVAGQTKRGYLVSDDLKKFPCADLLTIDQLWVEASKGHFGFSVQKKIWKECGSPMIGGKEWDNFCAKVGWKKGGSYVNYSDLPKNPHHSLAGELPCLWGFFVRNGAFYRFSSLAQRLVNCSTSQS